MLRRTSLHQAQARRLGDGAAAAGFGPDVLLQLLNGAAPPALANALELIASFRVSTAGSEESQWKVMLAKAGVLTAAGGFSMAAGTGPFIAIGDPASITGFRAPNAGEIDLFLGSAQLVQFTQVGTTFIIQPVTFQGRAIRTRASATAVAPTITLPNGQGNMFPLTVGTGTLNSIVPTAWPAGSDFLLECPAGITITHNVAGTGATILTPTGASIVTASTRMIPVAYNGTNMIVVG